MKYEMRKANDKDAVDILKIYNSLIGTPGCTWNKYYPSMEDIKKDLEEESLYVVCHEKKIIATAVIGHDEDIDNLQFWNKEIKNPCCLHRLGVLKEYQRRGIAKSIIENLEKILVSQNYDGLHFLVGQNNIPALNLYNHLEYQNVGETIMYDKDWFCYEKYLGSEQDEI